DIIARLSRLQILRLTHSPVRLGGLDEETTADSLRIFHMQIANDVMQYLAAKGSPVQLLASSPTVQESRSRADHQADSNGHTFPHYFYVKGTTSMARFHARDLVKVTAIPVKKRMWVYLCDLSF
ncbi:hypothetical protein CC86DRAFT_308879, partial [Ophiobolus disseminans]